MKTSKLLTIGLVTLALSLSTSTFATAKSSEVAVVDIQQIVTNSPQINALKTEQRNKINDLASFVEKAKTEVNKETNDSKKKALEEKYNKELNVKKEAIDRDFSRKMIEIDKDIQATIESKTADYDLVLVKGVVLKGGKDITSEIVKSLK